MPTPLTETEFKELQSIAKTLDDCAHVMGNLPADEIGLAMRKAYRMVADAALSLVESEASIMPTKPKRVRRHKVA